MFPLKEIEFVGLFVIMTLLFITNIGGIGGGGTTIPVILSFLKFDIKMQLLFQISVFLLLQLLEILHI